MIMNGWRDAPHCWKHYLARPFWLEPYGGWTKQREIIAHCRWRIWQIQIIGFVIFADIAR